jgi:hypothetical protein
MVSSVFDPEDKYILESGRVIIKVTDHVDGVDKEL